MRRTKEGWAGIVESYQASGLTVRQFCKAGNIGEQSLRNWNKRIMQGSTSLGPPILCNNSQAFEVKRQE
jgi:hypothetical protein